MITLTPLQVWVKVEDEIGKGLTITQDLNRWRLHLVSPDSLWCCIPGPDGGWVTSFDCRGSAQWAHYLEAWEAAWPGTYTGPKEAKWAQN